VCRPAVEWCDALLGAPGAAAAVGDAVGACGMPRHTDHQTIVMAEVGRPPLLRIRHQGMQVLDHGIEIKGLEFLGVIERRTHRIRQRGVPMENLKAVGSNPTPGIPLTPLKSEIFLLRGLVRTRGLPAGWQPHAPMSRAFERCHDPRWQNMNSITNVKSVMCIVSAYTCQGTGKSSLSSFQGSTCSPSASKCC